mmetsp:Transcript_1927/g.4195  ORF Transcript_1927/g.4195 Transcript_1927/m.4195 type:complete len:472 (+) Transcript_1927:126-1541(+)
MRSALHDRRLLAKGVAAHDAANRLHEQLRVIERVAGNDGLIQVAVKRHLLHVVVVAELDERFARRVAAVEELLQDVEHLVREPVLLVPLVKVHAEVTLVNHALAALALCHDRLRAHSARLGGEVDALSGALCHVSGGIADERNTSAYALRPRVLRDGVCLNADDLSSGALLAGSVADRRLVLLDGRLVDDSSRAHGDVVVLREHPAVEVGRDVVSDVHFREVLVVLHLLVRQRDALLEGDGVVVLAGTHRLGDAGVGTVGADDDVNLELRLHANGVLSVERVVRDFEGLFALSTLDLLHESVDKVGAVPARAASQEVVHHLTAAHADVLLLVERLSDVHLAVGRRDHLHLRHTAIDDFHGQVKLLDHAERDGSTARLAVVHLSLDEVRLASSLGEHLGGARAGRSSADDGNAKRPVERLSCRLREHVRTAREARGGRLGCRSTSTCAEHALGRCASACLSTAAAGLVRACR